MNSKQRAMRLAVWGPAFATGFQVRCVCFCHSQLAGNACQLNLACIVVLRLSRLPTHVVLVMSQKFHLLVIIVQWLRRCVMASLVVHRVRPHSVTVSVEAQC